MKKKQPSFIKQMIGFRPQIAIFALVGIIVLVTIFYTFRSEAATAWPLKVSADGHYFVDQTNKPFLYVADTVWTLFTLSETDAKQFIDVRKEQGFSAIQAALPGFGKSGFDGDMTKPNAAYMTKAMNIVKYAESKDMVIYLGALWGGLSLSNDEATTYGTWLGTYFKNANNILWFVGGDRAPDAGYETNKTIASALKAAKPDALISYHMWGLSTPWHMKNEPWYGYFSYQWNGVKAPYTYDIAGQGRNQTPAKPFLNVEPAYEPNAANGETTTPLNVRNNGWWAILGGAAGVTYGGSEAVWNARSFSSSAVQTSGGIHTGLIYKILSPYPWEKLVPDASVVTNGGGSYGSNEYVTAGRALDGSLIVAYLPRSKTITVDMSKLSAPAQGYWVNPTSGAKTDLGANLANSGSKTFTPSVGGDGDAVLILSTGAPSTSAAPQVSPTTVVPTFACLGTTPCVPTATPGTGVGPQSLPTTAISPAPSGTTNPTSAISPGPITDPINNPGNNNGNNGNKGFIEIILEFFRALLELLLSLFR